MFQVFQFVPHKGVKGAELRCTHIRSVTTQTYPLVQSKTPSVQFADLSNKKDRNRSLQQKKINMEASVFFSPQRSLNSQRLKMTILSSA